ncbi:MAG: ABC transporter permease [Clostridiaceae bacterium]|nr:ABC transporter permease [Clostridiaceae bacterium]
MKTLKNLCKSEEKLGLIGIALLVFFLIVALLAPTIAPFDPYERVGKSFDTPSSIHLLGTNDIGQDIFSEIIYGTRFSLSLALLASFIAIVLGVLIGVISGYFQGVWESFFMRLTDFILIIPFLPLVIIISAYFSGSFKNLALVIGLTAWPSTARIIRSQVMRIRSKDYILNLKAMGGRDSYILKRHILREVLPIIVYRFMMMANSAILIEASLSFLGLGSPTIKSWGTILYYAQVRNAFLTDAWVWWILPPGICISLLSVAFLFSGYYVESRLNPKV